MTDGFFKLLVWSKIFHLWCLLKWQVFAEINRQWLTDNPTSPKTTSKRYPINCSTKYDAGELNWATILYLAKGQSKVSALRDLRCVEAKVPVSNVSESLLLKDAKSFCFHSSFSHARRRQSRNLCVHCQAEVIRESLVGYKNFFLDTPHFWGELSLKGLETNDSLWISPVLFASSSSVTYIHEITSNSHCCKSSTVFELWSDILKIK